MPGYVRTRSDFLFTVILSVAAKYQPHIPLITHKRCLALAKTHLSDIYTNGCKDEEAVMAM